MGPPRGKGSRCCSGMSVGPRGSAARPCPGEKDLWPRGNFSFLQCFRPVGGGLWRGDRPCQGRGLACAPCSAARSACPAIPSVVGAETRSPVRHSPSLLLCLPFSLHPSNLISCQGEARALSSSSCSCGPAGAAAAGKVKKEESLGERELPPSRPQCCGCSVAGGGLPQLPRTEAGQGEESLVQRRRVGAPWAVPREAEASPRLLSLQGERCWKEPALCL